MPNFEIVPEDSRNTYKASVASNNDYTDGEIRVEPPFLASDSYIDLLRTEAEVIIREPVSGKEATLLSFVMVEEDSGLSSQQIHEKSNEERVRLTVESLLDDLGKVASIDIFKQE